MQQLSNKKTTEEKIFVKLGSDMDKHKCCQRRPKRAMGDIVEAAKMVDGGGSSSLKCPMLNSSNYTVWAMKMRILLNIHKVWSIIEEPKDDNDMNDMALGLLFLSIPEALILQVRELDTTKKVWDAIQSRHVGAERVKEARLQTLMAEFDRLKMKDTERINDFAGKLSEISSKSAALGEIIDQSKLVKKFLKCLPQTKYIHIVASLEQVLDLNKTSFEEIIGRLKVYEERVVEEEEESTTTDQGQTKLLYANNDTQSSYSPVPVAAPPTRDYNSNYRGRSRGGRYYRGRGRGGSYKARDLSEVTCFRCDKQGHFASRCPDRLLKLQETQERENNETENPDELMLHEIVFLNEKKVVPSKYELHRGEDDLWYLDNGASNHMTGDLRYFSKVDYSITGEVKFGDDLRINIKGKGTVKFTDEKGELRTLTNVYYIPGLKSNIISLGQATKSGYDVRMKGEYLTVHDQEGKLLVKSPKSRNQLYRVRMGIKSDVCLQFEVSSDSYTWHARMGHVNFESIKSMIQKELVTGVPHIQLERRICSSCLFDKCFLKQLPFEQPRR
ncbi:PREDICTED: uncharacterized protein LOC104783956 isoform X2 [Camelina sativa]|uniref:Uncharacterized protein LOC104783956 isoform X2 n=1 Tax=Camelina sativa TaxID=90675 RepID=A0ABM0YXC3_CAMSA|nr:PREDICTED: uncharacterized protein LOC104783956 isoform X2 [Camelina sativa]